MIFSAIKNDFYRISTAIGGEFESLAVDELQLFVQDFKFDTPLINMVPINSVRSELGVSGVVRWIGTVTLDFLQLAEINSTENEKDIIIDQMVDLSVRFLRKFQRNELRVFNNPSITMNNNILRFKTSNYCVGISVGIDFETGCNRI